MRIQPSTVALGAFLMAVLTGWAAHAQDYPAPMMQELGFQGAGMPPEFAPQAGPWGYPPGAQGQMNAYPNISPYGPPMEQTYNEKGVWYRDTSFQKREYIFSLEYLRARMRRPGTDMIGDPGAFTSVGIFDPTNPVLFPTYSAAVFNEDIPANGMRGRLAMVNTDDTSLDMSVWFVPEASDSFDTYFGEGDPLDVGTIFARGSIPLDDGVDGVLEQFDTIYRLGYSSQSFGGNIDWVSMPIVGKKGFGIRGVAGLKFLHVQERFTFYGQDSGLSYDIAPDGSTSNHMDVGFGPYSSSLNSVTSSYLAGPEVGIRYDLGSGFLRFWGQTTVAVAANNERIKLSGTQFGDPFITPFPTPTPLNPNPGAFEVTRNRAHVSPIIDTQIFAELDVFKALPGFKKSPLFRNAKFRLGYNFIVAEEMVRPTKIIVWTAPNPDINTTRSRWTMGAVSFAVDWRF